MPKELGRKFFHGTDVAAKRDAQAMVAAAGAGRPKALIEMVLFLRRETRTLQQNRWYWGFIVKPFADFLAEQEVKLSNAKRASEAAHRELACECLGCDEVMSPRTGEVIRIPWETHTLDIEEFGDYADRCIAWLAKYVGIPVDEPNPILAETVAVSVTVPGGGR